MKMPVLFVGHGSPMNAIEENEYTKKWEEIGREIPKPKGVISISAHWYTDDIFTNNLENPVQIYDMYGFPEELYNFKYPVKGSEKLALRLIETLEEKIKVDNSWGIDHGTWAVLCKIFPKAEIPVVQISLNGSYSIEKHYEIGRKLRKFRDEGYLIFGSGNVVHNLRLLNPNISGYDWAYDFDNYIKINILNRNFKDVINYKNSGESYKKAFFTLEHFLPLIYILGASYDNDNIEIFNESCVLGSLSMTSYLFK
ncbi:4,5-DOPA dioxygenase extradiol [Miniphocaeibacter massiliensis]|uniref:4,5-DOPA-extradiol-dioxygenase n=1 Tax=Miniphocaeibacter massiliensis TaxID=2041841 RepID=UPI000C081C21|nr:4,5-DOPA dioxygenase extradiol [Miniphocaeibacter massiliensis]